jgi:hypothetical protein
LEGKKIDLRADVASSSEGVEVLLSFGRDSLAAGSDSLDSPESSLSGFLFLLRLSGEATGGGEFEWEELETCSDSEILSEEPALFSDYAGSLSRMEVSCELSLMMARSGTSPSSGSGGREERVWWFCIKRDGVNTTKLLDPK